MGACHGIPTGVHRYHPDAAYNGYTLVSPYFSNDTHLINMEGEIVHTWHTNYFPGLYAELLPDGTLFRGVRIKDQAVRFAGTSGGFQRLDWDGNVLQEFFYNRPAEGKCLSHAFAHLPNGNVLALCLERKSLEEAYAKGRLPGSLPEEGVEFEGLIHTGIYPEFIMEIDRNNNVVWEWHMWDHVGEGPDKWNINFHLPATTGYFANVDWVHFNCVDYDPATDRILLCSRNHGEIFAVDRTSGAMVWRWGNPSTHGAGRGPSFCDDGDQKLFGPHNAHFLDNGHILVHDNGWLRPQGNRSRAVELVPGNAPDEAEIVWEYTAYRPMNYCSPFQSACQRLPNGNTLITASAGGQVFEVTGGPEHPRVVWEFIMPWVMNGQTTNFLDDSFAIRSSRSAAIHENHMQNMTHRAYRYAPDHPALRGRDLSHARPIAPDIVRIWETEPYKSGAGAARQRTDTLMTYNRKN